VRIKEERERSWGEEAIARLKKAESLPKCIGKEILENTDL